MTVRSSPAQLLVAAAGVVVIAASVVAAAAAPSSVSGPATAAMPARRLQIPAAASPSLGGCPVLPADNAWNQDISALPVAANSGLIIDRLRSSSLHPDFGENPAYGIPFVVVAGDQPLLPVTYDAYGDESDPGPFPIPLDAPVEGGSAAGGDETGSDRHVIVLRQGSCDLFELFGARRAGSGWVAQSGARFALTSNALRPVGWTSADAAGLPILPGLVRADEVLAGAIRHAIRVTFARTRRGFILPATHFASADSDPSLPAMGQRLRLRGDFDLTSFHGQALVIATALQRYGLIVADNGSDWFFQGAPSALWDDDDLGQLKLIDGSAFDVVDTGPVRTA